MQKRYTEHCKKNYRVTNLIGRGVEGLWVFLGVGD